MKLTGIGSSSTTSQTRKTDRKGGAKADFSKALTQAMGGSEDSAALDGGSPVAGVDALLAAQSVGDAPDRESRRRMAQRAEDILDKLDQIRHGLLMGELPRERLEDLITIVRSRRETVSDLALAAVLDEIELRAEVEIAKLARGK